MKEKILTALKNKYKNLGFGDKAFDGVASFLEKTVTEETQVETAIAGVELLLKAFQGDTDARVSSALAKQKAELEKPVPDPKPGDPKPAEPDSIQKIIQDAIKAAVEPLNQKIAGFEKKATQEQLNARVMGKLKEKGIPDSFLKRASISVEKESEIETLVTDIESDFNATKQELINKGLVSDVPKTPSEAENKTEIENYLSEKFPETKK